MYALIGRVLIKPERAEEALALVAEHGVAMVRGMPGASQSYWARSLEGELIQHSFWVFDSEENARAAQATFMRLREMPDAPASLVSVDVCEVIAHT